MTEELDNVLRENAAGPAKVGGDAGSVEQHSLSEQIAADKYLASKEATKKKGLGLKFTRLSPPGAS